MIALAKLYFSYAAMNAGKSTILLQASYNYRERGMRTLLFTSALYAETDDGQITSRIGIADDAELYAASDDLFARIETLNAIGPIACVFVDEAQFLTQEQAWQLARVADRLNIPVLCYGLRTDFRGALFEGAQRLFALADEVRELKTICYCGRKATMNLRIDDSGEAVTDGDTVVIGGSERYESLCRRHFLQRTGAYPQAS
mgnify:CR=1 FL=1